MEDGCTKSWGKLGFPRIGIQVPVGFLHVLSVSINLGDGR